MHSCLDEYVYHDSSESALHSKLSGKGITDVNNL